MRDTRITEPLVHRRLRPGPRHTVRAVAHTNPFGHIVPNILVRNHTVSGAIAHCMARQPTPGRTPGGSTPGTIRAMKPARCRISADNTTDQITCMPNPGGVAARSEEHTSELQSRGH